MLGTFLGTQPRTTPSWSRRPLLSLLVFLGTALSANPAEAVRSFVTDDARIVYKGQLEIKNFADVALTPGQKPSYQARSLQGFSVTDRLEIIAGGFGPMYENRQVKPVDLVFQP